MRYALTGATGFVGGALARLLRDAGHEVVALVRDPAKASPLADRGVSLSHGDLDDTAGLDVLCAGVDGLFHVAGWYRLGSRTPQQGWRINVDGTRNVLSAATRAPVPRTVYTSTLAVNSDTGGAVVDEAYAFRGRHISAYDETKAHAHDAAAQMAAGGAPVVTVMPGVVYGPDDTSQSGALLRQVIEGRRPMVPAAGRVCWAHVVDIAQGHLLAMERGVPGESYMLAGERASLAEALMLTAEIAGTRGPVVIPAGAVRASAGLAAVIERVVPLPAGYASETLRTSLATYLGTAAKAERDLGWTYRSLRTGLAELVRLCRTVTTGQ
ncbi:MAG: NAD-dependent epimerase/dehydratase family protein [Jiangellaceae bacterium]